MDPAQLWAAAGIATVIVGAVVLREVAAARPPDCPNCGATVERARILSCEQCGWRDFGP